jgi:peptidoglycan/LPS O-acetylase OafA/YrhL
LKRHRFHELDSLRAIAALGVICWHYVGAFGASPFSSVLAPFYGRGLLMVEFFFVLSGFVLTLAFWQVDRQAKFNSNVMARIGRLYPLHIATLLAVACMQWWVVSGLHSKPFVYTFNDVYHFVLNLFLIHATGLEQGGSFNAPSWSISTEFWVNVIFLGLIAFPRRFGRALALLATAIGVTYLFANGLFSAWRLAALANTLACFFVGVTLYQIHARLPAQSSALWGWLWTTLGVLSIAWSAIYLSRGSLYSNAGDAVLCCIVFPCLIISSVRSPLLQRGLRIRPLVYLGEISYSIYLVHFPVQLALHCWSVWSGTPLPVDNRWFFVGFFGLVIAVASATYYLIENPGRRWLLIAGSMFKRTAQPATSP